MSRVLILCLATVLLYNAPLQADETLKSRLTDVFVSGTEGYNTFRIPSLLLAANGDLLAFCEGRLESSHDTGDIQLLMKRSTDNGKTWSKTEILWADAGNTCGNPCPVVDQSTGTIWMLMTWNSGKVPESKIQPGFGEDSRRVYLMHSTDHGQSWSNAKEITRSVKKENWTWYATGPGNGIQITQGSHKGRLVIPCDIKAISNGQEGWHSHIIYSDDHGSTWQLGGIAPQEGVNECAVAELADGRLMLNMRNRHRQQPGRQVCLSSDGGLSWTDQQFDKTLIEPVCQASLIRADQNLSSSPTGRLLFSNPASQNKRERLTIRLSEDNGKTWSGTMLAYPGSAAYSALAPTSQGFGCLFEVDGYKRIVFLPFAIDDFSRE